MQVYRPSRSFVTRSLLFLVSPEILVRSASKPFVVVSFALEELLEVRLAVKFAMEGSVGAEAEGREAPVS